MSQSRNFLELYRLERLSCCERGLVGRQRLTSPLLSNQVPQCVDRLGYRDTAWRS
jgi:hypothetical protein